jgi:hypothetical protein
MRWDEVGLVRAERCTADPDLLLAPASRDLPVQLTGQGCVHCQNRVGIQPLRQLEGGSRGRDVANDLRRVGRRAAAQLGESNGLRASGQALDRRRRRRLRAQESGREQRRLGTQFGIEARDLN